MTFRCPAHHWGHKEPARIIGGFVTNCPQTWWLQQQSLSCLENLQFGQGSEGRLITAPRGVSWGCSPGPCWSQLQDGAPRVPILGGQPVMEASQVQAEAPSGGAIAPFLNGKNFKEYVVMFVHPLDKTPAKLTKTPLLLVQINRSCPSLETPKHPTPGP